MSLCYFSIAAVICCHKFSSLKPHKFIISQLWRSEVWVAQLASLFNLSQSWNKTVHWPGLLFGSSRKECLQTHANCWQNSVPCGCRTKVSFPCWLLAGSLFSASGSCPHSLVCGFHPPSSKPATSGQILLMLNFISLTLLPSSHFSLTQLERLSF